MVGAVIPKIIHLVWFGPIVPEVEQAVDSHALLNPNHTICLHTTDDEVHPSYRKHLDTVARLPQLRSDLLRWSLLEKCGGWYFDIDIVPRVGVERIEEELNLDGRLLFLTRRGSLPNNDIMAIGQQWPYWDRVHNWLDNYSPIIGSDGKYRIYYSCFSWDVILRAVIGGDGKDYERWTIGPDEKFAEKNENGYAYRRPFEVPWTLEEAIRGDILQESSMSTDVTPSLVRQAAAYGNAIRRWVAAGCPTRSDEEIDRIFHKFCKPCEFYDVEKHRCKACGCGVETASGGEGILKSVLKAFHLEMIRNKIALANLGCPKKKWPADWPPPEKK